jgi:CSLREA domain-containing protein
MLRRMTPSHPARIRFAGACALLAGLSAAALAPTTVAAATVAPTATGRPQSSLDGLHTLQLPKGRLPLQELAAFGSGVTATVAHLRDSGAARATAGRASDRSRTAVARPRLPKSVTTFAVNSTADDPNASATSTLCRATNGKCTLRAAVTAADNLNKAAVVKLPAGSFVLSDTTAGTMIVTDAGALSIEGVSPAKTTISVKSGDAIEPFAISENAKSQSGVLFLSGLTIRDGSATDGGALALLSQDATAVVTDVTLESNIATNGGAIFMDSGHLWLTDSTVSGNKAVSGGGILVDDGTVVIADSSIVGNSASQSGGGLFMVESTGTIGGGAVSFNSAGTSSTAGDGGGIALVEEASLSLSGTNVNSNTVRHDGEGGGLVGVASEIDIAGGQLSHNAAPGGAGGGALLENVEAMLSNVAANSNTGALGGIALIGQDGVTSTLDILGGSISHNSSEAVLAFGESAGSSVSLDIAGTELENDTTTTSAEIPCGSAVCAAASAGGAFQLTLARDTIEGDSAHISTQLGGAVEVIATEGGSGSADLQGDTVDYDSATGVKGSAGAILMASVADPTATPPEYSPLAINVTDSTFEHDSVGAGGDGGAIGITTGTTSGDQTETSLVMSGDTFEHDVTGTPSSTADDYGGALAIAPTTTGSITDSTFSDNTALGHEGVGGAIFDEDEAVFSYAGDSFTSNSAGVAGGALVVESLGDAITQCSFSHNTAASGAGAIFLLESLFSISDSTISASSVSSADGGAGGIELGLAQGTISNSTISGNSAGKSGDAGGIAVFDSLVALDSDTITSNHAKLGSGLYTESDGQDASIRNSIISHNTTKATGGSENDCALSTTTGEIAVAATSEGGNVLGSSKCVLQAAPSDKMSANPKLAPLANNGGSTETMALQPGSPALKIALACLPTDQRGKARPATNCDSGAFELTKA